MTPDPGAVEGTQLAQIEADLAGLSASVDAWINERFVAPAAGSGASGAPALDVADVNGLIVWLRQWHGHFDGYRPTAAQLDQAGHPALMQKLAAVRLEIDNSIENFRQLAQSLPNSSQA